MAGTVVGPQRSDPEAREARAASARPAGEGAPPGSAGATAAEFLARTPAPLGLRHPGARAGRVRDRRQRGADGRVVRGARRRARAAREDDDGPGPLGAAARRGRLGDHAGHAVAGAGGRWRSDCAGCMLANALVDPVGIAAVSRALDADPELQVLSWVDSVSSVAAMDAALAGLAPPPRPLTVLVELGAPGGRTGARDLPAARAVAAAVAASPHLHLGGVAGYEGALAHDASPAGLDAVRRYLRDLAALHAGARRHLRGRRARSSPPAAAPTSTTSRTSSARWPGRAPGSCCARAPTSSTTTASTGASRRSPGTATPRSTSAMHAWARVVSPTRARARPARRRQAGRPVRRGAARAAAGRRRARGAGAPAGRGDHRGQRPARVPAPARRHRTGRRSRRPAGPVAPLHGLRQVAGDPGGRRAGGAGPRRRRPRPHLLLTRDPVSTLIRAATVVDGTERPRYRADVLVDGPRIAAILPTGGAAPAADRVLDADGLVLAPGFIDMHAHSDLQILLQPDHLAKISQGVTTELLGQDGLSYAPVDDDALAMLRKQDRRLERRPGGLRLLLAHRGGVPRPARRGASPATRPTWSRTAWSGRWSCGWDDVPATRRRHRGDAGDRARRDGRGGRRHVGRAHLHPRHVRRQRRAARAVRGRRRARRLLRPAPPLLRQGRAGRVRRDDRPDPPGRLPAAPVPRDDELRAEQGPGRRAAGHARRGDRRRRRHHPRHLPVPARRHHARRRCCPSWSSAGGQDATLARLRDPAALARIRERPGGHGSDGCHGVVAEWDTIEISGVAHAELDGVVGRTIARDRRRHRARAVRRRSSTCSCATSWAPGSCSTSGTRRTCRRSCATRGTRAAATACWSAPSRTHAPGAPSRATSATTAATWACSRSRSASGTSPGAPPRGCGCATAAWSGPGYAADLVLFDPATVADAATFADPRQPAAGIPYVFVNGELAMDDGRRTGALAGRALRRLPDGAVA